MPSLSTSRNRVLAALAFSVAIAAPGFGQIFWSNVSPAGLGDDIWCVTYADSTFAAVTKQGNLLTSADGLAWTSQTIDQGTWLVSIAYGNGLWVVVGANGTILVSSNLRAWTQEVSPTTSTLNGVLYNGSVWVAVGENGEIVTSTDSTNWSLQAVPAGVTGFLHGITWDPVDSQIVVTGQNAAFLTGSIMGTNFLSVHAVGVGAEPAVGTTQNLEAVLYEPAATVAVGGGGTIITDKASASGQMFWSDTGEFNSWRETTTSPPVIFRGLTFGNGYWVAAGEQGAIYSSADAITWTQRIAGDSPATLSSSALLGAAYSPNLQRFVVTGTGGAILVSDSSPTVFANVSTRGFVSSSQSFIGGFYVAGAAPRTVLVRADGPSLSAFAVASPSRSSSYGVRR